MAVKKGGWGEGGDNSNKACFSGKQSSCGNLEILLGIE